MTKPTAQQTIISSATENEFSEDRVVGEGLGGTGVGVGVMVVGVVGI